MKWLSLALVLLVAGCAMATKKDSSPRAPVNQCHEDRECASGGGHCVSGMCVASQGVVTSLMFQVEAPGNSSLSGFAGKTLTGSVEFSPSGEGLDLTVPGLAYVNGTITLPPSRIARLTNADCKFDFSAWPLTVTLSPRMSWPGLPVSATTTTTNALKCECDATTKVCTPSATAECAPKFSVTVPAGDYDLYVEQKLGDPSQVDPACQIVPSAFEVSLPQGLVTDLTLTLADPKPLTLGVSWPGSDETVMNRWVVDMLDPTTGRRLSTQVVLESKYLDEAVTPPVYVAELEYLEDAAKDGNEIVRLAPPSGGDVEVVAQTVLVARPALELFGDRPVLNQLTVLPSPVAIQGSLVDGDRGQAVPGTVTFVATELDGVPPGSTFRRSAQFDKDATGLFNVKLLPGRYRVYAQPAERCPTVPCPDGASSCDCPLASSILDWVVAANPSVQAGKSVPLSASTRMVGAVTTPLGQPAFASKVRLAPEPAAVTPLQSALGDVPMIARTSVGTVDPSGHFSVGADPVSFQLTYRPASNTGFPWYVRPELVVDPSQAGTEQDLGTRALPLPVRYSGSVTIAGTTTVLPEVVLRAYAYLSLHNRLTTGPDDPLAPAVAVIQIAETTTNSAGGFDLLIPAWIDEPPP